MINTDKLKTAIAAYKDYFPEYWSVEKYKWAAVKHFQDNWDIKASDFASMFETATDKTINLLASSYFYPAAMIIAFAKADAEATRAMFVKLFDESVDLRKRVEQFQADAENMREKHDQGGWKNHYQNTNAISTYLWLRYPDKYYIYKYSECMAVAKELESDFLPKATGTPESMIGGYKLYDEICAYMQKDKELASLLKSSLTEDTYPDPSLRTMTIDFGYFVKRFYTQRVSESATEWFPSDYSPNLSVDTWVSLLKDKEVFTIDSLEIMKRMKDYGGMATCKQLAAKYGGTWSFYNVGSSSLAKRVAAKTGCPRIQSSDEKAKWWPILYIGREAVKGEEGSYVWKLRDELSEALGKVDLSDIALYEEEKTSIDTIESYTKNDFLREVYMSEERYDSLNALLTDKKNIIIQGAPGVGKTFAAKRLAYARMGKKDDTRVQFIQFHQNYAYEDFVMGYKPQGDSFKLINGIFYRFCEHAANNPDEEFFFIIDEINRGNMSKILGELLMLIEKDYRGTEVTLAYSGMKFSVPPNLYLIGLMNTADRSLAMIDYALRRRFSFFIMEPAFNSEGFREYQKELNNETFKELIDKIGDLNREITDDHSLGAGFCIGHSYFCNQEKCEEDWMKRVVHNDIIPMLSEYWFDDQKKLEDWEKALDEILNV